MQVIVKLPKLSENQSRSIDGIIDETALVKALLVTLAGERIRGNERIVLEFDITDADPCQFITIAKSLPADTDSKKALH
jgi:hypothetical protein